MIAIYLNSQNILSISQKWTLQLRLYARKNNNNSKSRKTFLTRMCECNYCIRDFIYLPSKSSSFHEDFCLPSILTFLCILYYIVFASEQDCLCHFPRWFSFMGGSLCLNPLICCFFQLSIYSHFRIPNDPSC